MIRDLRSDDSISELTKLLHRAYRRLALMDLHFVASTQDDSATLRRCQKGRCLVAEFDGRLVGTVTVQLPGDSDGCDWYGRGDVAVLGQFAVEPALQGTGLGSRLMKEAERIAADAGASEIGLDTAEGAEHLIVYYRKRGYRLVGSVDWKSTNYVSVVMSKRLGSV